MRGTNILGSSFSEEPRQSSIYPPPYRDVAPIPNNRPNNQSMSLRFPVLQELSCFVSSDGSDVNTTKQIVVLVSMFNPWIWANVAWGRNAWNYSGGKKRCISLVCQFPTINQSTIE